MDRHRTIDERFLAFHLDNPGVYARLVSLTRKAKARGRQRIGIQMLFEVIRWETMLRTTDTSSEFKINNDYASRYARMIMRRNPDLDGMFETRRLTS